MQSLSFVTFLVYRQKPLAVAPRSAHVALKRLFVVPELELFRGGEGRPIRVYVQMACQAGGMAVGFPADVAVIGSGSRRLLFPAHVRNLLVVARPTNPRLRDVIQIRLAHHLFHVRRDQVWISFVAFRVHGFVRDEERLVRIQFDHLIRSEARAIFQILFHTGYSEFGAHLGPLHHIFDGLGVKFHCDEVCAESVLLGAGQLRLYLFHLHGPSVGISLGSADYPRLNLHLDKSW